MDSQKRKLFYGAFGLFLLLFGILSFFALSDEGPTGKSIPIYVPFLLIGLAMWSLYSLFSKQTQTNGEALVEDLVKRNEKLVFFPKFSQYLLIAQVAVLLLSGFFITQGNIQMIYVSLALLLLLALIDKSHSKKIAAQNMEKIFGNK